MFIVAFLPFVSMATILALSRQVHATFFFSALITYCPVGLRKWKPTKTSWVPTTLSEVASAVRASSLDLPAGIIRTESGNVLVRTEGKAYIGEDFENIILRSEVDGTQLLLSDVADVRDEFTESVSDDRFDRQSSIFVGIFSLKGQNLLDISKAVHAYAEKKQESMSGKLSISVFDDEAYSLNGRLTMMSENLLIGGILVALVLGVFLNLIVALSLLLYSPHF